MKLQVPLTFLYIISAASAANLHPLSDEYITVINQRAKTWKAGKNFEIDDWERVKRIASGVLPRSAKPNKLYKSNPHNIEDDVPDNFDSREAWPNCDSIKQIRDQSNCSSGWAFGAVEAMSDRICIHSNQTKQVSVSAEELIACCYGTWACGKGCDGGWVPPSWDYWQMTGIVTGGLYNSSQGCQDYSLPPCEHGVDGDRPQCSSLVDVDTPTCATRCYNASLNYRDSKTFGQRINTFDNEQQIQLEIYKNGPVEASFTAYVDLLSYKSGVYQRTTNEVVGDHAIKIIGWGTEDDIPYWLISNSWNSDWGDNGFFKMLRGFNHCGVEEDAAASLPVL